jgi:hypothetical protein
VPVHPFIVNLRSHCFILNPSDLTRRRALRRLILRSVTSIGGLRLLQLNVVTTSVGGRIIICRRRVVAVVVVGLCSVLLGRLVLLRLRVVRRLTVAWRCATESPSCAAVGLVAVLSATAGSYASFGSLVILVSKELGTWVGGCTYEKRKKMKIAPKMIRPRTSQRAQLFQVLPLHTRWP